MTSGLRSVLASTRAVLVLAACADSATIRTTTLFVQAVSLNEFETALDATAFTQIAFTTPTGLVAREIKIEADQDAETIASRTTAINTSPRR